MLEDARALVRDLGNLVVAHCNDLRHRLEITLLGVIDCPGSAITTGSQQEGDGGELGLLLGAELAGWP